MFIYNVKVNSKNIVKISFIIMTIIITIFFIISIYKILTENFKIKDTIPKQDVVYIESNNYTNILKSVYEDLNTYIGQTINFTGYVYRNIDFEDNQFVLARDMLTDSSTKTLIVGFLCDCSTAKDFQDNEWVEVTGKISKGNYHGEIPIIKIVEIKKVEKPNDEYVYLPDDTYIPTSVIF